MQCDDMCVYVRSRDYNMSLHDTASSQQGKRIKQHGQSVTTSAISDQHQHSMMTDQRWATAACMIGSLLDSAMSIGHYSREFPLKGNFPTSSDTVARHI